MPLRRRSSITSAIGAYTTPMAMAIAWTLLPPAAHSQSATHRETASLNRPEQSPQLIDVTIPGTNVTFGLSLIPGGGFLMGSPDDEAGRDPDEGPRRYVYVDSFWMATHEVTFDEYTAFRFPGLGSDSSAGTSGSLEADAVARPSPPYEDPAHGMGNHGFPASGMTQWGALHYARWLSDKTGHFFRLPTEAEWEYACRAGVGGAYSFGDDPALLDVFGWHYGNSDEVFHQVGEKEPNAWGLYDMHGNVSEWTLDQYTADMMSTIPDSARSPWVAPTTLHPRTVRGGAYDDDPEDLRCAARLRSNINWKRRDPQFPKSFWWNTDSPFVGFRLVRPVSPPSTEEQEEFWRLVLGE